MNYLHNRPNTIICDIDGTLVKHASPLETSKPTYNMELLPGTISTIAEWDSKGYNIILLSGRRESSRIQTEKQLAEVGIIYDQLILGVGGGVRHLVNDKKPDGVTKTAVAYNLTRDVGIINLNI
jgi:hydroxymethylpyrimidine pyrophosphatase-like HAD family hydrolase|tara:strand:- start:1786 stop:2157 length:372 start_codon:yes stop_codon:yes gene_type:complete